MKKKKKKTTTTYRHRSRQYSCTQQKHGPYPTIRLQTGDIQRREDLCVQIRSDQIRSTGLGCMIKIPTVWQQNAVEIRTSTAEQSRGRYKPDPVGSTQPTAAIALLLHSLNSAHSFTSTRKSYATLTLIGPRLRHGSAMHQSHWPHPGKQAGFQPRPDAIHDVNPLLPCRPLFICNSA